MSEQTKKEAAAEPAKKPPPPHHPPLPPPPTLLTPPPASLAVSNSNNKSSAAAAPSLSSSGGGGGGLGLSSSPSSLSSLPPPPALMTPLKSNPSSSAVNNAKAAINGVGPPPPPATAAATAAVSISSTTSKPPLPPPPTVMSSSSVLPPPPTLRSTVAPPPPSLPSSSSSIPSANNNNNSSSSNAAVNQSIHSTTEQIPPLSSAPNTGNSVMKDVIEDVLDDDDSVTEDVSGGGMYFGSNAYQVAFHSDAAATSNSAVANAPQPVLPTMTQPMAPVAAVQQQIYQQPATPYQQQPAVQQQQQQHQQQQGVTSVPPTSGSSWTAWAGDMAENLTSTVTTNVPVAGSLLEKAGQLAYSTVESAGDYMTATADYNHPSATTMMVGGGGTAVAATNMIGSPGGSYATPAAVDSQNATATSAGGDGGAVKDNFANLFTAQGGGGGGVGGQEGKPSNHDGSAHITDNRSEGNIAEMMATPDTSVHPSVPPPSTYPPTISKMAGQAEQANTIPQQPQQQNQQQLRRPKRAAASPPQSTLAPRQSTLSVLILPTAEAQSIASRNNTTLSELFRIFGNTTTATTFTTAHHHTQLGGGGGRNSSKRGGVDSNSLEPMLPPFRSANRSMALSWENISLNFVSNSELDGWPIVEGESERALGEAVRLWDEDRLDNGTGENLLPGGNNNNGGRIYDVDVEMDQLEGYVVDALAEDEEEERIRKKDGIPSMTSVPPSRRNSQLVEDRDAAANDGKHHQEQPFPPRPEEALQSTSDAAFALTAHPTSSSWLRRFRHTLDCCTDGMYHEMLCNPSVVILVASTSESPSSYVNCLAELANVHHLPKPYHDGRYDPNGLRREFLLLHDVTNGPKDFDENKAMATMRERFGAGCCAVLRVNSLVDRSRPVAISDGYAMAGEGDEWENGGPGSPFVNSALSKDYTSSLLGNNDATLIRGACLSPSDKRAIRRYVANMVATGLVPAIERRIANLNSAVTNAKKGVKNVIKSFWRKPKENILVNVSGYDGGSSSAGGNTMRGDSNHNSADAAGSSSSSVKYRYDSIESQTRLLADTLFLMRDYEAALSAYRLVKDDYKHDKAHLHYASTQEMMVLCMHMLDPSGRDGRYSHDVHHSIETALYSYTRASDEEKESNANSGVAVRPGKAPYATRLATRLCITISATRSLCENKHMEIADLLASASSHETPLGAAILLEQSSAHYYRAGMLRKYAFHMLMAGHMFRSAGKQERHAFRCFAASLYVYHGERWGELRSHLRSALAAQLYGMGRYALSMQFYAKLIGMMGGGRVSLRSQQKFLNHIVNICNDQQLQAMVAIDRMNENGGDISDEGSAPRGAEDILKGFANAVRQIEISNIGFPHVKDASIQVCVDSTGNSFMSFGRSDSTLSSGDGDESVWQDMTHCANAELRSSAAVSSTIGDNSNNFEQSSNDDGAAQPPSALSGDGLVDTVITEIDKEEREAEYRERQKRKGNVRTPDVRATSEPLAVTFSLKNPLGLDIELVDMQLVASLASPKLGVSHTNEFPVSTQGSNSMAKKRWTFHGSDYEFQSPNFMCQLFTDNTDSSEEAQAEASDIDEESGPHFVVTKSSVKMGPNSDTVVTLKICPLVEGDLRILGVRFHLLGEVWIYHRFDLPGPLLQDTQINRSKRVRGESLLLTSKVEREMPSLKVTITPDESSQSTVLQGQTSRWKLKLTNVGYAAASNIMLKTNAPWLNLAQLDENKEPSEDAPTSHCVGPSGTLMRLPLTNADKLDILQPGETIEVPVAIRTSGGGRQDFYMLFRYEIWSEDSSTSNLVPRHRWARKRLSVPVYPSITMSASLMPSYSNKGEHILSVELVNYRSDRDSKLEIYLNKICIASRHFEIRQLRGQVSSRDLSQFLTPSSGSNSMSASLKIGWQERVTLHYLVVPIGRANSSVIFSSLSFSSEDGIMPEHPNKMSQQHGARVTDFMCRERAHEVFNSTVQTHRIEKERILAEQEKTGQPRDVAQIRRDRSSLPEGESNISSASDGQSQVQGTSSAPLVAAHPTSLASLCPLSGGSNINIICCWSALVENESGDDTIHGQHHLRNLLVRPLNQSKGCPLALTAKYKPKVSHNFDEGPLDEDIVITIRNRLIETEVEFEFAIDHQPGFDFVGTTCFNWSLSGLGEIAVPLKARIYSGGAFNLQNVRLTVLKAGTPVPYLFPLQWTMLVEDGA